MTKLNYSKLVALKPTVYTTFTNKVGQTFDLVEHPLQGDAHPVIIVFHKERLAVVSDFWDTEDLTNTEAGDYHPVYIFGEISMGYEVESEYPL